MAWSLGGRVPPRVEDEHVVGLGEGEAEAARLEADEEHRVVPAPERVDRARPGRGCGRRGTRSRCPRRPAGLAPVARKPVNWLNTSARWPSADQLAEQSRRARRSWPTGPGAWASTSAGDRLSWRSRVSEREDRDPVAVQVADQPQHLLALGVPGACRRAGGAPASARPAAPAPAWAAARRPPPPWCGAASAAGCGGAAAPAPRVGARSRSGCGTAR